MNWSRYFVLTFSALLIMVPLVAGFIVGIDWIKEKREASRSFPSANSPNILLIVLDTVRADRLSLYGYLRNTSPILKRRAERAIRFDQARVTAPWTLPSHASMFTGRWAHELGVKWNTPLRTDFPTVAEYLGAQGYATAGFVANTMYCSYDTGLNRGFTHYEDYEIDGTHLRPLRMAVLFELAFTGLSKAATWVIQNRYHPVLHWFLAPDRKDAGAVNREFLDWLSHRKEQQRPFFAFLNYYDAHSPYLPPQGTRFRFGAGPRTVLDFLVLVELWKGIDKLRLGQYFINLILDSYDNCLAYLDWRLGQLFDELERSGQLDRTVMIITADHGEEMGEHGLFEHGESLYRPEIHVPLLVFLPSSRHAGSVVRETVSLRDLAATIVDLAGLAAGSPFPGRSLARFWEDSPSETSHAVSDPEGAISALSEPNPTNPSLGRSPAARGPLISLAQDAYVYIRNEGDGQEELFNEREDPLEFYDRSKDETMQPILQRLRQRVDQLKPRTSRPAIEERAGNNRLLAELHHSKRWENPGWLGGAEGDAPVPQAWLWGFPPVSPSHPSTFSNFEIRRIVVVLSEECRDNFPNSLHGCSAGLPTPPSASTDRSPSGGWDWRPYGRFSGKVWRPCHNGVRDCEEEGKLFPAYS